MSAKVEYHTTRHTIVERRAEPRRPLPRVEPLRKRGRPRNETRKGTFDVITSSGGMTLLDLCVPDKLARQFKALFDAE